MNYFNHSNVSLLIGALLCVVSAAVCAPAETPTTDQLEADGSEALARWTADLDELLRQLRWSSPETPEDQHYHVVYFGAPLRHMADCMRESEAYKSSEEIRKAVRDLFEEKSKSLDEFKDKLGSEHDLLVKYFDYAKRSFEE